MPQSSDDRRDKNRRAVDDLKFWVPILLSLISTVLALGVVYGKTGGRLDLIEYRLQKIESRLP